MNKLLIIAKNPHTYFIERLAQEAKAGSVRLLNPWEEDFLPEEGERILVRSTAIHGSSNDLDYIHRHQLVTLPSLKALSTLRTKPLQFQYFMARNITHLPWLDLQQASSQEIELFSADKSKLLIKPHRGQGGWGVRVFNGPGDLLQWHRESSDREYLLQPYLEDHQEVRIFFMRDKMIALKRLKKGVAANFHQDGEALEVAVPEALKEIVDLIRLDLNLRYGAADFLIAEGMPYLLEMNLVPGIEQLEMVTGRNIARELLDNFMKA